MSLLYRINMYPFQDLNNIVNCPARSMWMFDLVSCVTVNTMLVILFDCYNLVNAMTCIFRYVFLRWSEVDYMRYIFTYLTVIFGQVLKNTCFIAAIQVDFVGLKHAAQSKFISSGLVFIKNRLLHVGIFPVLVYFYFCLEWLS